MAAAPLTTVCRFPLYRANRIEKEVSGISFGVSALTVPNTWLSVITRAGFEPAEADRELIRLFQEKQIPFLVAVNKADAAKEEILEEKFGEYENRLIVSGKTGFQIQELKEKIANLAAVQPSQRRIAGDLLKPGDTAVLVVPIDQAAPKGRLILPQQQTIRDILEADAAALVVKENGLKEALKSLGKKPALVITDSQVFGTVSADTPKDMPISSHWR